MESNMATSTSLESNSPRPVPSSFDSPPFPDDVRTAPLLTISLKKLVEDDTGERQRLFEASKSLGFMYLDMRGCEAGERLLREADKMFWLMDFFFDLPMEEKAKCDFSSQGSYFGYKGKGREVMDDQGTKDYNEMYNISKDDILGLTTPLPAPDIITYHRPAVAAYISSNYAILETLFTSLNTSLRLPPSTLSSLHRKTEPSGCHTRFIRGHPSASPQTTDQRTLGEHTDFGSLTILFNRLGGLQVQLPDSEEWVYVRPVPGCAIVNLGDAMVKFTAEVLRSNLHRVVDPPGEQKGMMRQSLVFFARPEHKAQLRRLKGGVVDEEGVGGEGEEEEAGVSSKEWLERRHMSRKIGVGFHKPGDFAKGQGTEASRRALKV